MTAANQDAGGVDADVYARACPAGRWKATFGTSGPVEDNARMTAIDGVAPTTDDAAAGGDPTLSGHVIVYGVRGVGLRTVEHLHAAGVGTVVVHAGPDDADPVADALLASWGVPQVTGRTREALAAARLDTAAAVICVPDDDLRSIETALLVRRVRPDVRLVVRMGNRPWAARWPRPPGRTASSTSPPSPHPRSSRPAGAPGPAAWCWPGRPSSPRT